MLSNIGDQIPGRKRLKSKELVKDLLETSFVVAYEYKKIILHADTPLNQALHKMVKVLEKIEIESEST